MILALKSIFNFYYLLFMSCQIKKFWKFYLNIRTEKYRKLKIFNNLSQITSYWDMDIRSY